MGGATPVYNENNFLEVPLGLSFHNIPSSLKLWKVGKIQNYFPTGLFFSILPKYWLVSMYTVMLSEFSFSKKRKQGKSNFRMVNYVMVEPRILWNYEKLYIWTSELN